MHEVKVTNQLELDLLPGRFEKYTRVTLDSSGFLRLKRSVHHCYFIAVNKTFVSLEIDTILYSYNNSTIYSSQGEVVASDGSVVYAGNRSVVRAYDETEVIAYDDAVIDANYNCDITAHDRVLVHARGHVIVEAGRFIKDRVVIRQYSQDAKICAKNNTKLIKLY